MPLALMTPRFNSRAREGRDCISLQPLQLNGKEDFYANRGFVLPCLHIKYIRFLSMCWFRAFCTLRERGADS